MFPTTTTDPASVNPPMEIPKESGQRLLNLLKSKNEKDDIQKIYELSRDIIELIRRHGLLLGEIKLAEKILSSSSSSSTPAINNNNSGGRRNKRKKQQQQQDSSSSSSTIMSGTDVQLLLNAIQRMLEQQNEDDTIILYYYWTIAAEIISSICEHMKTKIHPDICFLAEYEVIANNVKSYLGLLIKKIDKIISLLNSGNNDNNDDEEETYFCALSACLIACTNLISIYGIKLSRCTAILNSMKELAWKAIIINNSNTNYDNSTIRLDAARLIATIPYAGGVDKATPSSIWNEAFNDCIGALRLFLSHTIALNNNSNTSQKQQSYYKPISPKIESMVKDEWIPNITKRVTEEEKANDVINYTKCLVEVVICLLIRDTIGNATATSIPVQTQLLGCKVNVIQILDLVQNMISFAFTSESIYYQTKKRLRYEMIQNGILSPSIITNNVANQIRMIGHTLFNTILQSLGVITLLPYTRKIIKIIINALQSSTSTAMQLIIDPSSIYQLEGKKKRWLHNSIPLRCYAIETFRIVILTFGTDPKSQNNNNNNNNNMIRNRKEEDLSKALTLISGCLIEELIVDQDKGKINDWGCLEDHVELVVECSSCLTACLNSGGDYISLENRSLIDSVTSTTLKALTTNHPLTYFGTVKTSVLSLGIAAVCTPWQDGASSSMIDDVKTIAQKLQHDPDETVRSTASSAYQICNRIECPRIPALGVVTRSDFNSAVVRISKTTKDVLSADDMVTKIQVAREDILKLETKTKPSNITEQNNTKNEEPVKKLKVTNEPQTNLENGNDQPVKMSENSSDLDLRKQEQQQHHTVVETKNASSSLVVSKPIKETTTDKQSEQEKPEAKKQSEILIQHNKKNEENNSDVDDFPMIVDCGPDEDDK